MHVVVFNPANQRPPRTGAYALDGYTLYPGNNTVADGDLKILVQHPSWPRLVALGAIEVVEEREVELAPEEWPDSLLLINSAASAVELETLPSIGPVNAERIFDAMPNGGYKSLDAVKGAPNLTPGINWGEIAAWEAPVT